MEKKEKTEEQLKIPKILPILPLRDVVVYPFIIHPLSVAREMSIKAIDYSLSENRMILLLSQKDKSDDEPNLDDLFKVGTVAVIMRMLKLPDNRIRVLVQGVARALVEEFITGGPFLKARIAIPQESITEERPLEKEALMRNVKHALERSASLGKNIPSEVMVVANNLEDPGRLADLVSSNLDLRIEEAQEILEILNPISRLRKVNDFIKRELDLLTMQREIDSHTMDEIDRSKKEYYLRQQLKAIQTELGEGNELAEEIENLREKAKSRNPSIYVMDEVEKQLKKLESMHPDSAEAAMVRNYLDWLTGLPWGIETKDRIDLKKARQILDEDHYGLEKVKERIIEYLSVRKLTKKMKGPILCFVGPPGVGKTSLGKSIARALGRNFVRISLGGIKDEAEIRGHRRTYVGAMPGRIVQGIFQAGSNNPLFMMDEVDKIGADYRGDPSSALLEVLDPEQNSTFRDHYLDIPFDLSNVMFITTANLLDPIQPAFRDRMETIHLSGYTEEEKLVIAKKHLIPKQIEEHGLMPRKISFSDNAIATIINKYTREAGLRNLEREIASICRKVAKRVAEGKSGTTRIISSSLETYLGPPKIFPEESLTKDQVGVSTGLAWTESGGDILFVEATAMRGRGSLILTGHLGEVMKESAHAALSYARSKSREFGIPENYFSNVDIHVHVPEGAIPKDGPSAGVTMATAMLSAFINRPIRRDVAMTGEVTLRGNVLPVGGIKEKILAARRANIAKIILPAPNRKNLVDIPKHLTKNMRFFFVTDIREVFEVALSSRKRERKPVVNMGEREAGKENAYAAKKKV
ncbi:MAG: endopeptidase La [Acidobacteriota bacterium]